MEAVIQEHSDEVLLVLHGNCACDKCIGIRLRRAIKKARAEHQEEGSRDEDRGQ
jgi:hypothetical protein